MNRLHVPLIASSQAIDTSNDNPGSPSQIQRAVGQCQGLERRDNGQPENGAVGAARFAAGGSRAIEIAVAALHQPGDGISAILAASEQTQSG
jgi:hypothetical protein